MYRGCRRVYGNLEITWIEANEIKKWRESTNSTVDPKNEDSPLKSINFFDNLEEVSMKTSTTIDVFSTKNVFA